MSLCLFKSASWHLRHRIKSVANVRANVFLMKIHYIKPLIDSIVKGVVFLVEKGICLINEAPEHTVRLCNFGDKF